jgi:nucleoside-diphosphate-sugar epimerase
MGPLGRGGRRVRVMVAPGDNAFELERVAEIVVGDVRDPATARALTAGAAGATLIHLAAVIHPSRGTREFTDINVNGTVNVAEAAITAGVRRIVVMSSNSSIGASRNPVEVFDEDSPYHPYMGYGRSKRTMEEWLLSHLGLPGTPERTIIRAPWFYGPEQPMRQTRFFSLIRAGRFPLVGSGENRRSMGYVDSLAYGILLAMDAPVAANRTYWLADTRPYSMREIVETVRTVLRNDFGLAVSPRTLAVPGFVSDVARFADCSMQKLGHYNQELHVLSEMNLTIACTIARAKRELGYQPLVDLREGMRRSVAWLLDHGGRI